MHTHTHTDLMRAVREVESGDVHSGLHHLLEFGDGAGGGA